MLGRLLLQVLAAGACAKSAKVSQAFSHEEHTYQELFPVAQAEKVEAVRGSGFNRWTLWTSVTPVDMLSLQIGPGQLDPPSSGISL
ncbi:hypothetical protein GJAV_G00212770 [Gymnothorax javanicus]|nr:hypothetical protein GJAV_G00212770 [Gymnothorax javanicus]